MKRWLKIERIPAPLASAYEKATRLAIDSYYRRVAVEIAAHFNAGILLDLGTGPGYLPIEIVKRAPQAEIVGIDLSRRLIRMAQANALRADVSDKIRFMTGNSAGLQFEDEAFDMAISTGMLHSLRDPVKVLREIYRVIKKGGEAWIYDPAQVASHVDHNQWKASLTWRERFFLQLFRSLGLHRPIEPYRKDQVIPFIEAAGIDKYSIEEGDGEIKIKLVKPLIG
jgi:ubiquinone/menaquinone biosynthesis C-methylase UbiE